MAYYLKSVEYIPDENGTPAKIMCPLLDDWIEDIDCLENHDIAPQFIPDKFKQKPEWKKICNECPFTTFIYRGFDID